MTRTSSGKILWALAVALTVLVAQLLPAAGWTICLRGRAPECCHDSEKVPAVPGQTYEAGRCDCCVAIDAVPADSSVRTPKSLIALAGPVVFHQVAPAGCDALARLAALEPVENPTSSLNTILRI